MTEHIAKRIDGFVSKDPGRVVDMWSSKKADRIHYICLWQAGFFQKPAPQLILDAGCGTGRLWHNLRGWGYVHHIRGFDVSVEAIKCCPASSDCEWVVASTVEQAVRQFRITRFDWATCFGPFAYTQGTDKWDCFSLLPGLRARCTHGVGYFMYTDKREAKPGPVFTRFHPDEVQERFPDCEVIVDDEMIAEYVSGVGYEDFDKAIIKW